MNKKNVKKLLEDGKNIIVERTRRAIFARYPKAVISFEYDYGEILFYVNKEQSGYEENLHSGYVRNGKFIDVTDF